MYCQRRFGLVWLHNDVKFLAWQARLICSRLAAGCDAPRDGTTLAAAVGSAAVGVATEVSSCADGKAAIAELDKATCVEEVLSVISKHKDAAAVQERAFLELCTRFGFCSGQPHQEIVGRYTHNSRRFVHREEADEEDEEGGEEEEEEDEDEEQPVYTPEIQKDYHLGCYWTALGRNAATVLHHSARSSLLDDALAVLELHSTGSHPVLVRHVCRALASAFSAGLQHEKGQPVSCRELRQRLKTYGTRLLQALHAALKQEIPRDVETALATCTAISVLLDFAPSLKTEETCMGLLQTYLALVQSNLQEFNEGIVPSMYDFYEATMTCSLRTATEGPLMGHLRAVAKQFQLFREGRFGRPVVVEEGEFCEILSLMLEDCFYRLDGILWPCPHGNGQEPAGSTYQDIVEPLLQGSGGFDTSNCSYDQVNGFLKDFRAYVTEEKFDSNGKPIRDPDTITAFTTLDKQSPHCWCDKCMAARNAAEEDEEEDY